MPTKLYDKELILESKIIDGEEILSVSEAKSYGITAASTEIINAALRSFFSPTKIECFLVDEEQWVRFSDSKGNAVVVSGFSWGYGGEGPHGLLRAANAAGFDIDIREIAGHAMNECWTIERGI